MGPSVSRERFCNNFHTIEPLRHFSSENLATFKVDIRKIVEVILLKSTCIISEMGSILAISPLLR